MRATHYWVGLLLLAALGTARAEWWTNQAGRVIEARLGGFDGVTVTLVRTNAQTIQVPLASLCPGDQRRVRQQAGQSAAPEFAQSAFRDASVILSRFEGLPASRKTEESRQKAVQMACSVFDARVKERAREITDPAALEEIGRLRARLADHGKN